MAGLPTGLALKRWPSLRWHNSTY